MLALITWHVTGANMPWIIPRYCRFLLKINFRILIRNISSHDMCTSQICEPHLMFEGGFQREANNMFPTCRNAHEDKITQAMFEFDIYRNLQRKINGLVSKLLLQELFFTQTRKQGIYLTVSPLSYSLKQSCIIRFKNNF